MRNQNESLVGIGIKRGHPYNHKKDINDQDNDV
jgi:hypothetical protein